MEPGLHLERPAGLPPALHALGTPCYLHRTPAWQWATLLALALAVAGAGIGFAAWRWSQQRAGWGDAVLAAFLALFAGLLAHPARWRPPMTMAADRRGVYLLGDRDSVFVPWGDIGALGIEDANTGSGTTAMVVLRVADRSPVWDAARRSRLAPMRPGLADPPGWRRLPVGTAGLPPERTRASLEALRRMSGAPAADPSLAPVPLRRRWEVIVVGGAMFAWSALFALQAVLDAWRRDQWPGGWILIPLAIAGLSAAFVRNGWRRR